MKIIFVVEKVGVLLPEFLSMAWSPFELLPLNLFSELLDGAVNFLVFLEVGTEVPKLFIDIVINPMSILQFDYQIQHVNLREVVLASLDLLQIIEKHEHDSCDFLFAVIIHDLGHFLNDSNRVVLEELLSEFVVAENPEHAQDVIANLVRVEAFCVKEVGNHHEILLG